MTAEHGTRRYWITGSSGIQNDVGAARGGLVPDAAKRRCGRR
jgi:hypothetical protein